MRLITHAHTHRVCLGIYPMIHVACRGLCNYSWDEGSSGGGLVTMKSFAPRINRRRRSSSTDPGSVWLLDTNRPCKRGCAANIPTLAGFSVFTSIRRPLTLALAAAVSDPVVLRRRRVGRQRLAFGFLRVILQKKQNKKKKNERITYFCRSSCQSCIMQLKHCKPSAYLRARSPLFTASGKTVVEASCWKSCCCLLE